MKKPCILLVLGALLAAAPRRQPPFPRSYNPTQPPTALPRDEHSACRSSGLWISPAVPDPLRNAAEGWGLPSHTQTPAPPGQAGCASCGFDRAHRNGSMRSVAPFPTVMDGVTSDQLQAVWKGTSAESFGKWPLIDDCLHVERVYACVGRACHERTGTAEDQLVDAAWEELPAWAIVPFEVDWAALEGADRRWAVPNSQGLRRRANIRCRSPFGCRPPGSAPAASACRRRIAIPDKLTTVIMTGTYGPGARDRLSDGGQGP